ncbi:hypothetical protein D3C80_1364060 [compost metagenome]
MPNHAVELDGEFEVAEDQRGRITTAGFLSHDQQSFTQGRISLGGLNHTPDPTIQVFTYIATIRRASHLCQQTKETRRIWFIFQCLPCAVATGIVFFIGLCHPQLTSLQFIDHRGVVIEISHALASPVSIGLQLRLAGLGQWIKTQIHHLGELCGGLKQPVRQLADLVPAQIHHVQIGQAVQPQRELGGVSIAQPQRMQTEQFADIRRSTQPIVG